MKQTAVEWLQEQLNKILIDNQIQQTLHLFEQAKEMDKQQHGETWDASIENYKARGENYLRAWEDFDDYYCQR